MRRGNSGFTLVEAVVTVLIVAVGLTAAMGGLSSLTHSEQTSRDREKMQRLAVQKFEELRATGELDSSFGGDFRDWGEDLYRWTVEVAATGTENLDSVRVLVERSDIDGGPTATVDSLIYRAPEATTTAGGGTP